MNADKRAALDAIPELKKPFNFFQLLNHFIPPPGSEKQSHLGKDWEIFHGGKRVSGKMLLRDKLVAKELFVTVENKTEAIKLAEVLRATLTSRET